MSRVIQTYLQGARHKANDLPCEDRTYALSENGVEVIALADGAGSKQYSFAAQGAACVTRTICDFFCKHFDDAYDEEEKTIKYAIMTVCQKALQEEAVRIGAESIVQMSSTLLCVAVKGNRAIAVHVGDGAIGGIVDNRIVTVSAPDNGEFASTTYFITMPYADEVMELKRFSADNASVFFMMSDGTQEYSFDDNAGTFTNGAAKMAMYVYEKDGQQRLQDTIQNMLINQDQASDDCSFIALGLQGRKPEVNYNQKVASKPVNTDGARNTATDAMGESEMDRLEREKYTDAIRYERARVQEMKKRVKMMKIVICVLLAVMLLLAGTVCVQAISGKVKADKPEITTVQRQQESSTEDKTEKTTEPQDKTTKKEEKPTDTTQQRDVDGDDPSGGSPGEPGKDPADSDQNSPPDDSGKTPADDENDPAKDPESQAP